MSVTSKELETTGSGADASPRHYASLGANGRAAASADVTEPLSIAQGMGGIMRVTGEADGPPISVGLPICDLGTGMWAVQGILAALYERHRTGIGRLSQKLPNLIRNIRGHFLSPMKRRSKLSSHARSTFALSRVGSAARWR